MDEFQHVYQTKRITFTLKNDLQVLIPHEDLVWNRQDEETMRTTSQDSDGINRSATLASTSCHPTLLTSSALDEFRMLATLRRLSRNRIGDDVPLRWQHSQAHDLLDKVAVLSDLLHVPIPG
ncbi:unnamed protein product [Miscanthus lutarioriparius]|uniref:Uncharacterized protein n=1 Tax=Miscanthus lutarioriparius TaxID=422564 RepID=A0A811SJ74_9POAL|nr:unnamed protein product [Miscanthus lutarioriparius]